MVSVTITTFGYGADVAPEHSDITLDIRRHVAPTRQIPAAELRTGLDPSIASTVLSAPGVSRIVDNMALLVIGILEDVADAHRGRLVRIAIGDLRGVHWAVAIGEEIARVLDANGVESEVTHREITIPSRS
ncbi:RNase adapter RapZ [Streptomyces scabiei]|uniref:RapZ C-terminal domain-containing protein n=1 Tax=Streptomyces scabiei TaxID=1930 RepID=UPI00298FFB0D|nr:RNase adapter RapZ [Streptomyces scabiei]MDW8803650.1 RNase adapter RapZ [Streptomyces scabiei]